MAVIIYDIKSFYLHNLYSPLLSCDLFARTPSKVRTHSAFKLSLTTADSFLANEMYFVEQSDICYSQTLLPCGSSAVKEVKVSGVTLLPYEEQDWWNRLLYMFYI